MSIKDGCVPPTSGRGRISHRWVPNDVRFIPFIHQQEVKRVNSEIGGRKVSIIFDGTIRLGEAMAIIVRFFDVEWAIQ